MRRAGSSWSPVSKMVDALDAAFYATFQNVEPCGKPVLLALDVSGSMDGSMIAGSCISAREASAAMALVTAATEPECEIIAFSAASRWSRRHAWRWRIGHHPGRTSRRACGWTDVDQGIEAIPMGGTDCALPMVWARSQQAGRVGLHHLHGQRNVGGQHPPGSGAASVSQTSSSVTRRRSLWA